MLEQETLKLVARLFEICDQNHFKIRTIESCTGGLLATYLTCLPGSSKFFDRGIVTYSNSAKHELCKIDNSVIDTYGAVSFETALKMSESLADDDILTIATTGLLGPDGDAGFNTKIGTVYVAVNCNNNQIHIKRTHIEEEREKAHHTAVKTAISLLLSVLAY